MLTYLEPPENIGITCQKEPFDIESLRDTLQGESNTGLMQEERLKRIPSLKKLARPADIMPIEEAEYKVHQYCHLWTMYADSSVELKKKSELSQESAVAACKMYVLYISDITHQIEEVVKIFAMEKELRLIKNRGYFPVPYLAPQECKIETIQDKETLIKAIDEVAVEMLTAIRESEENDKKKQEQARIREEQLRSARQTSRSDINLLMLANSTPIRNTNTRSDQPEVHFNTNPVRHVYATTSDRGEQYKPPENDSILQGATSSPADQFTTNTTDTAGRNELWKRNNATNVGSNTFNHRTTTRPTSCNGLQINNPSNPTDLKNGPTCFRCGEQGHMRGKCRKRVFCNHCRSYNHDTKACRKQHDKVAFKMSPNEQESKTVIVEYAKKLPVNTRDKLLRKIAKKNSYIKMLDDAFKQALDINLETSFVEAPTGRYNDQNGTKIETQINELSDSFQEYDINAMNTRSTNRSGDGSWNGSFDRSSSKNNSFYSPQNSRSNYRNNSYPSNNYSYNRQNYSRDNGRNRNYQQHPRYEQRNQNYTNRYDNNQDRNRYDNNQDRHRFDNRRRPNKYQHHRNQHKAQVIFEFSDQNVMEMMQTVRGFINLIKANPTTREQYKSNKLATRKYNNEVNESEIQSSSLEQVQEFFNEDSSSTHW